VSELYALPEHDVVEALLPWVDPQPVETKVAVQRISETQGIVPLAIDPRGDGSIIWADLGDAPFKEWQYIFTIKSLAEAGRITSAFRSSMDVLRQDQLFEDSLDPSGFIFHISRCGSTLFAKSLAQLDENIVINQGAPLQHGFWAYLTGDWRKPVSADAASLQMFRNLIRVMTRPRVPGVERAFVKFISWNVLYADFIQVAFPNVPTVFLYRSPSEVIASVKKATTAALTARGSLKGSFISDLSVGAQQVLSDTEYLAHCYAHYFKVVETASSSNISCFEYPEITAENLPFLLRKGFNYCPTNTQLAAMRKQFLFHSKDDSQAKRFADDSREKRAAVDAIDTALIEALCGKFVDHIKMQQCDAPLRAACVA